MSKVEYTRLSDRLLVALLGRARISYPLHAVSLLSLQSIVPTLPTYRIQEKKAFSSLPLHLRMSGRYILEWAKPSQLVLIESGSPLARGAVESRDERVDDCVQCRLPSRQSCDQSSNQLYQLALVSVVDHLITGTAIRPIQCVALDRKTKAFSSAADHQARSISLQASSASQGCWLPQHEQHCSSLFLIVRLPP